jgi:hypothetical protein
MEDRRLWTLALVFGMVVSLVGIVATVLPLYIFDGNVRGYVSLASYDLTVFGEKYYSLSLEAVKPFAYLLIAQAGLNIIAIAVSGAKTFFGRKSVVWKAVAFGAMLSTLVGVGILYGCAHIVSEETKPLLADFSHETSAGKIVFPKTMCYPQPAYFLVSNFIPLALAIIYAITTSIAYAFKQNLSTEG